MLCFSLWFWLWCAFYYRPLEKHIILLSKCTSRLVDKRIHIKLVSSVEGRKNPMLSVVSYICVSYHPGGCRFSKWWPQKVKGALSIQNSSYQAFFVTLFTTGVGGDYNSPEKSKNKSPKYAYVVPWHRYGSPLSIHTKLSIKISCMTSQWRHEACLDSKTVDFHEFPQ